MALLESLLSIIVLVAVIFIGLKIIKNFIIIAVLVVLLAAVLYYFGYLLPF
ncbi:MAG: hypothetical protein HYU56_04035 [Candidatus Aenigmarchaeota archaeon]|nr:hypothetical protein [Candidatus Aenigmarchaeota archaeon]